MELLIIPGMSGAGKSQAANTLEDLGWYCIDNMPAQLIPRFAEIYSAKSSRIGMAKDALLKSYIMSAPAQGGGVTVTCKQTSSVLAELGYDKRIRSLKTVMSGFGKGK